jgi:hypothetical protein
VAKALQAGHGRRVVSHAQVVASRKRRAVAIQMVVPTAVRVEAGWDRTAPAWAFPNRLRITDRPLDTASANTAAGIRDRTGVSWPIHASAPSYGQRLTIRSPS